MAKEILGFRRLSENAKTPTKVYPSDAGYDLFSPKNCVVPKRGRALIFLDIVFYLPKNCYGRIASRSGLSHMCGIEVGAGVIDSGYIGNVGVLLYNHSDIDFNVNAGDRIAQLICEKILKTRIVEMSEVEESDRGVNGFGSSGRN